MIVLSLDIASITGWAVFSKDEEQRVRLEAYDKIVCKGGLQQKVCKIYSTVGEMVSHYKPDVVVIEDIYIFKNPKVFRQLAFMQCAAFIATHNINPNCEVLSITSGNIRKSLFIKGRIRKDIKEEVCKKMGIFFDIDITIKGKNQEDIADAIAVGVAFFTDDTVCNPFGGLDGK